MPKAWVISWKCLSYFQNLELFCFRNPWVIFKSVKKKPGLLQVFLADWRNVTQTHCLYSKSNKEEVTIKINHGTLICIDVVLIWDINHSAPFLEWLVIGIRGRSGPSGTPLGVTFGPENENLCGINIFWATFIFGTKIITKFLDLIY